MASVEEIGSLYAPLYRRFENMDLLASAPPLLAHYTSIDVMQKILEHEEVWFSNPLFMNDFEEMRFGMIEGSRIFTDQANLLRAGETPERAAAIEQHYNAYHQKYQNEGAFDTYIFCLSQHKPTDNDGLPQRMSPNLHAPTSWLHLPSRPGHPNARTGFRGNLGS